MFATYPDGAKYGRHEDNPPNVEDNGRRITNVFYMNSQWTMEDAGLFRLYPLENSSSSSSTTTTTTTTNTTNTTTTTTSITNGDPIPIPSPSPSPSTSTSTTIEETNPNTSSTSSMVIDIIPGKNRLLMFWSDIPHEVLPTKKDRLAFSMWFHDEKTSQSSLSKKIRKPRREKDNSQDKASSSSKAKVSSTKKSVDQKETQSKKEENENKSETHSEGAPNSIKDSNISSTPSDTIPTRDISTASVANDANNQSGNNPTEKNK